MTQQPKRAQIMLAGISATTQARNVSYGEPVVNLSAAGELKQVMRRHLRRQDLPIGTLEAIDQVLTKVGRIITGSGYVEDTYIDGATYFAIAGEIDYLADQERKEARARALEMKDQAARAFQEIPGE